MKSGTTSLFAYLEQNPEICFGDHKELHYFDLDRVFRGKPNYHLYHARFDPLPSHKILAEGTPAYLYWPQAAERMHAYNPDLKFVALLRNPIDRAYSHWNMTRSKGTETLSFSDALQAESNRLATGGSEARRTHGYVYVGRYVEQLERLWRYFPRSQTLLLRNEALQKQPQDTVRQVCEFAGVTSHAFEAEIHRNVGQYTSRMTDEERRHLVDVFEPEVRALEKLTGWDCSDWLK
jgi:hypothetical protein